ncbi:MAG: hypothetical protein K5639_03185 [Eubacterium sp.]|nr:hypothetical protein [Eubacterium sp.]
MAEKEEKKEETKEGNPEVTADADEDNAGSKVITAIIVIIIVAIWLAIFGVLIKLDVGGFGSEVLYPVLKDVPIINNILPEPETKSSDTGYYTNLEAANAKIQELEKKLAATTSSDTMNADEIEQLKKENARLKKFEDERNAFAKRQSEFQKNVLFKSGKPDAEEYKKYYSEISEDNAEKLFKLVAKNYIYQQELSDQADIFSKMQPANAAKTLTEMTGDLQLIADILNKMQASKRALIIDKMDWIVVEKIERKMSKG